MTHSMVSRRRALAACAATLLAYVGLVHEIVGSTLYPQGPAAFGGPVGWHLGGMLLFALGALTMVGTLGVVQVPTRALAGLAALLGLGVFVAEATKGGFHFFALTMMLAGGFVVLAMRD